MDYITHRTMIGILVFTSLVVIGVRFFPPLTLPDQKDFRFVDERAEIHRIDEAAFCQETLSNIDCGCFSYRASAVLRSDVPRIKGMSYADKWHLAVTQASASCQM